MIKKIGTMIAAIALVSTAFVATVSAANPIMYLDYEVSDDNTTVDIITKVKGLPSSMDNIYDASLGKVGYGVYTVNNAICVNDAEDDLVMPAATTVANALKSRFKATGLLVLKNWTTNIPNTPDASKKYLVGQGNQGDDATAWTVVVDENGVVECGRITLSLVDANAGADTTISIGNGDITISNLADELDEENENKMWGMEESKTYKSYGNAANLTLEPAVIKISGTVVEKIPTATTTGKQNGVKIGDGYTGDTDATDVAAAVGVGVLGDGNVHNELLWEVTADIEGASVTKTHKSTVSVDGDAAYKFGLVIQGLAQSAITAVTAVLQ